MKGILQTFLHAGRANVPLFGPLLVSFDNIPLFEIRYPSPKFVPFYLTQKSV